MPERLTVVIPLYNKESYLRQCLLSVTSQTVQPYEIIVVDDGSTDNGPQIARDVLESSKIRYRVVTQPNSGVSVARNHGISLCDTEYVALLDADDEWKSTFLEVMSKLVADFPGANLYSCNHEVFEPGKGLRTTRSCVASEFRGRIEDFFQASSKGSLANSSKVIVKKSAMQPFGGFPVGIKAGEDLFVWIMLALSGPVVYDSFIGARVNSVPHSGKELRIGEVPYPLVFFSAAPSYLRENENLTRYLWRIYIRHYLFSLSCGNKVEAQNRYQYGKKLFPVRSRLFSAFSFFPSNLIRQARDAATTLLSRNFKK